MLTSRRLGGFHGLYDNDQIIRTKKKKGMEVLFTPKLRFRNCKQIPKQELCETLRNKQHRTLKVLLKY